MNDIMILLAPTSPAVRRAMEDARIATVIMEYLCNHPLSRCKDIQDSMGGPYKGPSIQKVSIIMRKLCEAGAVQRIENPDEIEFVQLSHDGMGKMLPVVRFSLA